MSYVVITGASAGIGECFARALAAEKQNLILVARREERLNALAAELKKQHGIEAIVLKADLADQTGADALARRINEGGWSLAGLINNAGLALGVEPADRCSLDKWEDMVDTNVKGLLYVTHALLPGLVPLGRSLGR